MKKLAEVFPEHCKNLVTADITEMLYDILQKDKLHYLKPEIFNLIKVNIKTLGWLDRDTEHNIPLNPAVIFKDYDISDYLLDNAYDLSEYNYNLSTAITGTVQPDNLDYFIETMQRDNLHINYFIDASVKIIKVYGSRPDFFEKFYSHIMNSEKLQYNLEPFFSTLLKNSSTYPKILDNFLNDTPIDGRLVIQAMDTVIEKDNLHRSPKIESYQKWKIYSSLSSGLLEKSSERKAKI